MSRPGFVLEVDERTPPLVVHAGDRFRLERFPLGTRVVYGPDGLGTLPDPTGSLAAAAESPADADPLRSLLRPGIRLTITFDDVCVPVPPMPTPDVRQLVCEYVLTLAADAGVDDVALVAATGLNRRLRPRELSEVLGERIYRSFASNGLLTNHDAENAGGLVALGSTPEGNPVECSTRVAESDLVVHVALRAPTDPAALAVPVGVCDARTLRRLANDSNEAAAAVAGLLADKLPVFAIGVRIDRAGFGAPYEFLNKREWEYSLKDRVALGVTGRALAAAPERALPRLAARLGSPHRLTRLVAGSPAAVGAALAAATAEQEQVEVSGQVDVLITGVAAHGRFNVEAPMNPVLAAQEALRPVFAPYAGRPLVRSGGAVIVYHPARHTFSQLHHPSYVDFFDDVLARSPESTTDLSTVENAYATDPWYTHLYRDSYAFHGAHPVLAWRAVERARAHVGDVVWVGADRANVARMGFRAASTLADALEMVAHSAGGSPSIGYLHSPPALTPVLR